MGTVKSASTSRSNGSSTTRSLTAASPAATQVVRTFRTYMAWQAVASSGQFRQLVTGILDPALMVRGRSAWRFHGGTGGDRVPPRGPRHDGAHDRTPECVQVAQILRRNRAGAGGIQTRAMSGHDQSGRVGAQRLCERGDTRPVRGGRVIHKRELVG